MQEHARVLHMQEYNGVVERDDGKCILSWKNTNQLLQRDVADGCKTGVTPR